tara:strand:+ start:143 stop:805 length:663 start_codon:yes stop_codon:yes gene_type:complete
MKNYLFGASVLLSSLVAPSFAEESKDFYLSIGGGLAFPSDIEGDATFGGTTIDAKFPTDDPFFYSLGIGKEFNDWRLEFNYSGTKISTNSITATSGGTGVTASITPDLEVDAKSYMIYGFKDIPNETKFTPYFGVGLGTSTLSTEATTVSVSGSDVTLSAASESVFTYGIKGGIGYEIANNTSIYSEASYLNYASFSTDLSENYDSNSYFGISAGLKFTF